MRMFVIGRYYKGRTELVMVRQSPTPKKPLQLVKKKQRRSTKNHPNHYLTLVRG